MNNTQKKLALAAFVIVIGVVTIGYAYLNSTLKITGTTKIKNAKWDVKFVDPISTAGNVTATTAPIISDDTTVTYEIPLAKPRDYYEFVVTVKNTGSIAAKLSATPTLSATPAFDYLDYKVTYEDGSAIAAEDKLGIGATAKIKVRVEYKDTIDADHLPSSEKSIELKFSMNYVQD